MTALGIALAVFGVFACVWALAKSMLDDIDSLATEPSRPSRLVSFLGVGLIAVGCALAVAGFGAWP